MYKEVKGYNFQKNVFLSLNIDFVLANSVDSDEMPQYAVFHLGIRCLPKCPFRGIWYGKGKISEPRSAKTCHLGLLPGSD